MSDKIRGSLQTSITRRQFLVRALGASAALAIPGALSAACQTGPQAAKLDTVKAMLIGIPWALYYGHYLADKKGFYKEYGINKVEFNYGTGDLLSKPLLTGEMDITVGGGPDVLVGRARGVPIKGLAAYEQEAPYTTIVHKDNTTIRRPKDLEGKTAGVYAVGDALHAMFQALIVADGGDPSKVSWVSVGPKQAENVAEKKLDAAYMYGPAFMSADGAGIPVKVAIWWRERIGFQATSVYTAEDTLKNPAKKDLLERFMIATVKGFYYGKQAGVEEQMKASSEYGAKDPPEVMKKQLDVWNGFFWAGKAKEKVFGWVNPEIIMPAGQTLQKYGAIPQVPPFEEMYSLEFLEKAAKEVPNWKF